MTNSRTRTRSEVEQEIRRTFGLVLSFFSHIPDDVIDHEWTLFKHWELGETRIIEDTGHALFVGKRC